MSIFLTPIGRTMRAGLALALAMAPAWLVAAVDLDGDGLDDVYAARFGVTGSDPDADLDGDGISTLTESHFNTDPMNRADRPEMRWAAEGGELEWASQAGIEYELQSTGGGLEGWTRFAPVQAGTGAVIRWAIRGEDSPGRQFFRLAARARDRDGDGLRDVDEIRLGTDPAMADTDGDDLPDGFEAATPGLNPLAADPMTGDADGNGVPDLQDYALTLGTEMAVWTASGDGNWRTPGNWSTGLVPGPDTVVVFPVLPGGGGPVITIPTGAGGAGAAAVIGSLTLRVEGAVFSLGSVMSAEGLELVNGAELQPSPEAEGRIQVVLTGDLMVDATSRVNATGAGYAVGEGPGAAVPFVGGGSSPSGGSHGGRGGQGRFNPVSGLGSTYGSITEPTEAGSGGSRGSGDDGPGGGVVRLSVEGTLQLDGMVEADGVRRGSSGAGGSVWIDAGTLAGTGTVRANGGEGALLAGAGGGGRVAVYAAASSFSGTLQARSGTGGTAGGAGSVFTLLNAAPQGSLIYDNGGLTYEAGWTPAVPGSLRLDADMIVRAGAVLSSPLLAPLEIVTAGNVTVEAEGAILLTGQGHRAGSGPGRAALTTQAGDGGSGGSHAGEGALGRLISNPALKGPSYGSITEPVAMGSGPNRGAGAGGGVLRMEVGGRLRLLGPMAADGTGGGAGGSGGSIWIDCGTLDGTAPIRADGGAAASLHGSGGGGRVAVYFDDRSAFTGPIQAFGGAGNGYPGGAGSVFLKDKAVARGLVRFSNGGIQGQLTPLTDSRLELNADVEIMEQARVSGSLGTPLEISIPGSLRIGPAAFIDLTGRGHGLFQGPGAPPLPPPSSMSTGAAHAGLGGPGWLVGRPAENTVYGSFRQPVQPGSGAAGAGGGVVRLVTGPLELNGEIRADGEPRSAPSSTGSGGSVWVQCTAFSGTGTLSADGGMLVGNSARLGGAGAGGRIAVEAAVSTFTGSLSAASPTEKAGAAGTVYRNFGGVDSLWIDNDGTMAGEITAMPRLVELSGEFRVRGGAWASRFRDFQDPIMEVIAMQGIAIEANARLDHSALALGQQVSASSESTPSGATVAGGFSHGGSGGYLILPGEDGSAGSYPYGSAHAPRMPGSGQLAGAVVLLTTAGTLTVDGVIGADAGDAAITPGARRLGSSGGSILLTAATVTGTGTLSARGGSAHAGIPDTTLGGGGGGRIAVYSNHPVAGLTVNVEGGPGHRSNGTQEMVQRGYAGTYQSARFPLNAVTGAVTETAPPRLLNPGTLESANAIRVFPEHFSIPLDDADGDPLTISFEAENPGNYANSGSLTPAVKPLEEWTSYLLHADPPAGAAPVLTGSITFDREIIGVMASGPAITGSNGRMGFQDTSAAPVYAQGGLELDNGDSFAISPDRLTLTVTFNTADGLDQLRVVTRPRAPFQWQP